MVLLPGDPIGLSPDEVTIPSLLRGLGYATKVVGKWHLGDQPEFLSDRHGFDDYFGLPYSNDMLLCDRADASRDDLGDTRTDIAGTGCRPAGRVDHPRTLLPVPINDPWVRAVYD